MPLSKELKEHLVIIGSIIVAAIVITIISIVVSMDYLIPAIMLWLAAVLFGWSFKPTHKF